MEILKITGLGFAYDSTADNRAILSDLSFTINSGESVGLIGANGVGKSTLLKLITGLLTAEKGEISVLGTILSKKTLRAIRKDIGYVFQDSDNQLFMSTIYEDVAFGPRNYGLSEAEVHQKVTEALKAVHIEDLEDRLTYRLSGGEKKLASIATVLALDAKLILLDEPTIALDPRNRRNLIHTVNALPTAKLIASHDLDFILDTCSRVLVLSGGGKLLEGPAETVLRDRQLLESCGLELPLSLSRLGM